MLKPRLASILKRELRSQNLQFSPYCLQRLEQLVSQGVQRMTIHKSAEKPGHVMQAERNLKYLVQYLADCAQECGTFPSLTNVDFDTAMNNSPAFWPYRASG